MKPTQLTALLAKTIPAHAPVLIKGAPGIGKTDVVTDACQAAGADLLISHPVVSDPIDFKGMPFVTDGRAEFLPFGDLRALIQAKKDTVFFLDDLGQAPPTVQAAAMGDLFTRLYEVVKHAADKLTDKTAIFRDSLITNIQDLVDLLPRLNLTDDPRLEALRLAVSDKLLGYEPDTLRKDQFARLETAQAAQDILGTMAGYTNAA